MKCLIAGVCLESLEDKDAFNGKGLSLALIVKDISMFHYARTARLNLTKFMLLLPLRSFLTLTDIEK